MAGQAAIAVLAMAVSAALDKSIFFIVISLLGIRSVAVTLDRPALCLYSFPKFPLIILGLAHRQKCFVTRRFGGPVLYELGPVMSLRGEEYRAFNAACPGMSGYLS
jgi:hypothetical protein